jgi:peptidylprolyl isomerase
VLAVALAVLGLALVAAACGDDKDDTSSGSTTTVKLVDCATVYKAGTETAGPEAITTRGAPKMHACKGTGQLQIIDEVVGTGAQATAGSTVTAQYSGVVADTGKEFDSSWSRGGQAISFPLDGVIQGWSNGIPGMKEGGRRTLVIPAALAYGANPPAGAGIPANADLVFTVDLEKVG